MTEGFQQLVWMTERFQTELNQLRDAIEAKEERLKELFPRLPEWWQIRLWYRYTCRLFEIDELKERRDLYKRLMNQVDEIMDKRMRSEWGLAIGEIQGLLSIMESLRHFVADNQIKIVQEEMKQVASLERIVYRSIRESKV